MSGAAKASSPCHSIAELQQAFSASDRNPAAEEQSFRSEHALGNYLITSSRKGISSIQLGDSSALPERTAWFLNTASGSFRRTGKACFRNCQIDETYIGARSRNKHFDKKLKPAGARGAKSGLAFRPMPQASYPLHPPNWSLPSFLQPAPVMSQRDVKPPAS